MAKNEKITNLLTKLKLKRKNDENENKTKTKKSKTIENENEKIENENENAKTAKLVTQQSASIQYGACGCYGRTVLNP